MSSEEVQKYKFDNLQPISFLNKFNKMVEEDTKNPMKPQPKQLKIFPLSKFPLSDFYTNMEGIFESGTRKKDVVGLNVKNKQDVLDEEFMEKHRNFMTRAIEKIIADNQEQQKSLSRYKRQYDSNRVLPPMRTHSEAKFKRTLASFTNSHCTDNAKEYQTANLRSEQPESLDEEKKLTYLQKVQRERLSQYKNPKNQKIKIKNKKDVEEFLTSREGYRSEKKIKHSEAISSLPRVEYNNLSAEDQKKQFISDLLALQQEQNKFKSDYAKKVEQQIARFNQEVKASIQKVKQQKFW